MHEISISRSLPRLLLFALVAASSWSAEASAGVDSGLAPRNVFEPPTTPAEHEKLEKRHAAIEEKLLRQSPIGIMKMSEDPSEKFFPEYWQFEPDLELDTDAPTSSTEEVSRNASMIYDFLPPLLPHSDHSSQPQPGLKYLPRNLFSKRVYKCPADYHKCNAIGVTDACCAIGDVCQIVRNRGYGDVGCCPRGETCLGSVSKCDTSSGYHSCRNKRNEPGCCAPGFKCTPDGCIQQFDMTTVTTVRSTTITLPTRTMVGVTTETITLTVSPSHVRTVVVTTTFPTSTRIIGPGSRSHSHTGDTTITTTTATAPLRPNKPVDVCPTGYYRCSAYYLGGCCRVGRDCHSTDCPVRISTEQTSNGVVTVVVEQGHGVTTITEDGETTRVRSTSSLVSVQNAGGGCAAGWYRCGVAGGGGCCPSGYSCTNTCAATQSGLQGSVPKAPTVSQSPRVDGLGVLMILVTAYIGLAMVLL